MYVQKIRAQEHLDFFLWRVEYFQSVAVYEHYRVNITDITALIPKENAN